MTNLEAFRASMRRLFEAEDLEASFKREAVTPEAARLMARNKSFLAQRAVKAEE